MTRKKKSTKPMAELLAERQQAETARQDAAEREWEESTWARYAELLRSGSEDDVVEMESITEDLDISPEDAAADARMIERAQGLLEQVERMGRSHGEYAASKRELDAVKKRHAQELAAARKRHHQSETTIRSGHAAIRELQRMRRERPMLFTLADGVPRLPRLRR